MTRTRDYPDVIFDRTSIEDARKLILTEFPNAELRGLYSLHQGRDRVTYEAITELYQGMRTPFELLHLDEHYSSPHIIFDVSIRAVGTAKNSSVSIRSDFNDFTLRILDVFDGHERRCTFVPKPPVIFIGHGQKPDWQRLKAHLSDSHSLQIESYESSPRAGFSVPSVLHQMSQGSSFAILLLTAEDQWMDETLHARENVVHELGLFQGALGTARAIALVERGCSLFSNQTGVTMIPFETGKIAETFGDVLAIIRREFPHALSSDAASGLR